MSEIASIKSVRKSQNLTVETIAKKLLLDPSIIRDIENDVPLKGNFSSYEKSYRNSIHKILGIPISNNSFLSSDKKNNFNTLTIIYFLIFFTFSVIGISNYIIKNYSYNSVILNSKNNYKLDSFMQYFDNEFTKTKIKIIEEYAFIDSLNFLENNNESFYFKIKLKPNKSIFFKIYYQTKQLQSLGELDSEMNLILLLSDNAIIDLSNLSAIEYLIFNGKKYTLPNDFSYYLKNFDISKLSNLK